MSKNLLKGSLILLAVVSLAGCATQTNSTPISTPTATPTTTPTPTPSQSPSTANSITYSNSQYGFTFDLPLTWTGYTLVNSHWEGLSVATGAVVETGPQISIRHPLWTVAKPRQDIPIMIFTLSQWKNLIAEKIHIGAAPIPPSELGRNATFVFALPARYNYAFSMGYQEVEQILQGNPIHTS